jgi:hypothetical protein
MAGRPAALENENDLDLGWVKMEGAEASEHALKLQRVDGQPLQEGARFLGNEL